MKKILFICSRNQWRSPTAEIIWRKDPDFLVRSAGTSSSARHTVSEADIIWADIIFVMEQSHKKQLSGKFGNLIDVPIYALEIPDEYKYMDEELVAMLIDTVTPILLALKNEENADKTT